MALSEWVKPVAYCEIDTYCQCVLLSRMQEGLLPKAPIWDDIRTLDATGCNSHRKLGIDIIYGGSPCQGFSVAGAGKGLADERSGLFYEMLRLAEEIKPKFIFIENVQAITGRGGIQVVNEIASLGYDCRSCIISAASVGALHRRERWFLLAYSKFKRLERHQNTRESEISKSRDKSFTDDGDTDSQPGKQADKESIAEQGGRETWGGPAGFYRPFKSRDDWQETLGRLGRCVDGLSARLDFNTERLRALGNSVVPQQVRKAWEVLFGLKND